MAGGHVVTVGVARTVVKTAAALYVSDMRADADRRFWDRVAPPNDFGCRLWTGGTGGSRADHQYGKFRFGGRQRQAHAVAWELTNGTIPEGQIVCHRCDVTLCCEPTHLFLGTDKSNAEDRNAKVRQARGEEHGRAKLKEEDLVEIRRQVASGESQRTVARRFGVAQVTVGRVVRRETWTWLEVAPEA
jgi:hypothetical protein